MRLHPVFLPSLSTHSPTDLLRAGDPSIYPLLALYGASSATTTFACIATVLHTPGLSSAQLTKLLASYVPFMLVPLCIAVDYGTRLTRVMRALGEGKAKRA